MIKIIELFGGIGATTEAVKEFNDVEIVDYVENDVRIVDVYNKLHNKTFQAKDINDYKWNGGPIDGIVAGFPCQDFSLSGINNPKKGQRSMLYEKTLDLISVIKPRWVILENVFGILQKKHKMHVDKIISTLKLNDYYVNYYVINSKDCGIPQGRKRVFFIATKEKFELKMPSIPYEPLSKFLKDVKKNGVWRVYKAENLLFTKNRFYYPRTDNEKQKDINTFRRSPYTEIYPTIMTNGYPTYATFDKPIKNMWNIRKLTVEEVSLLMGWKEKHFDIFNNLPFYRAIHVLGNSMVVPVMKYITKEIITKLY